MQSKISCDEREIHHACIWLCLGQVGTIIFKVYCHGRIKNYIKLFVCLPMNAINIVYYGVRFFMNILLDCGIFYT